MRRGDLSGDVYGGWKIEERARADGGSICNLVNRGLALLACAGTGARRRSDGVIGAKS